VSVSVLLKTPVSSTVSHHSLVHSKPLDSLQVDRVRLNNTDIPFALADNVECRFTKDKPTISNKYPCVFPTCPYYGMFN